MSPSRGVLLLKYTGRLLEEPGPCTVAGHGGSQPGEEQEPAAGEEQTQQPEPELQPETEEVAEPEPETGPQHQSQQLGLVRTRNRARLIKAYQARARKRARLVTASQEISELLPGPASRGEEVYFPPS